MERIISRLVRAGIDLIAHGDDRESCTRTLLLDCSWDRVRDVLDIVREEVEANAAGTRLKIARVCQQAVRGQASLGKSNGHANTGEPCAPQPGRAVPNRWGAGTVVARNTRGGHTLKMQNPADRFTVDGTRTDYGSCSGHGDFTYEHTRIGKVQRWCHGGFAAILGVVGTLLLVLGQLNGFGLFDAALISALCISAFDSLTVQVLHNEIRLRYGAWIYRKTILADDLQGAATVRCENFRSGRLPGVGWLYKLKFSGAGCCRTEASRWMDHSNRHR